MNPRLLFYFLFICSFFPFSPWQRRAASIKLPHTHSINVCVCVCSLYRPYIFFLFRLDHHLFLLLFFFVWVFFIWFDYTLMQFPRRLIQFTPLCWVFPPFSSALDADYDSPLPFLLFFPSFSLPYYYYYYYNIQQQRTKEKEPRSFLFFR